MRYNAHGASFVQFRTKDRRKKARDRSPRRSLRRERPAVDAIKVIKRDQDTGPAGESMIPADVLKFPGGEAFVGTRLWILESSRFAPFRGG